MSDTRAPHRLKSHNALLLSGGGARAAYQVGVLKALADLFPASPSSSSPPTAGAPTPSVPPLFDIYCGVSAGAINALALATTCDDWHAGTDRLVHTWRSFHVEQVYRTDQLSLLKTALPWIKTLVPFFKKSATHKPLYFLDNAPLEHLLTEHIDFSRLEHLIDQGTLHACSVSCSSYHSGQSVTFFQAHPSLSCWEKERRIGVRAPLTPKHLLASSALPLIFPAQCINNEWFGDGSMRQIAPLSSCIHLNAQRILVVGTGKNAQFETKSLQHPDVRLTLAPKPYPSLAQIGAHILNGLFVDSLYADMERFARTHELIRSFGSNHTAQPHMHPTRRAGDRGDATALDEQHRANDPSPHERRANIAQPTSDALLGPAHDLPSHLRPIDLFVINPSQKIDEIASSFVHEMPEALLKLLRRIGATETMGGGLASYLLFEPAYCNALIELGYSDAWNQKNALRDFFKT